MNDGPLLLSIVSLVTGIVLILTRNVISKPFCRFGKWALEDALVKTIFGELASEMIHRVYDEKLTPKRFLFLGIIFLVQGTILGAYCAIFP